MKKKRFWLVIAAVSILSLFVGAFGAGLISEIKAELRRDFSIVVDGEKMVFKNVDGEVVYPILFDGTTYLPIRAIGELMGKTVYWYESDKRIELKDEKTTVTDADVIVVDEDKKTEKPEKTEKKPQKVSADKSDFIGEEKAKAIVLERAELNERDVQFIKVRIDEDRGIPVYEIEFRKDRVEYDAEINAKDGTVIEWDVDKD